MVKKKDKSRIFNSKDKQSIISYINSLNSDYIEIVELNQERSEIYKRWYFAGLREHLEELGYISTKNIHGKDKLKKEEINYIVNYFHEKLKDRFIEGRDLELDGRIHKANATTNGMDNEEFTAYCEKVFAFLKDFAPINYNKL